jgi:hypothetical protein
MPLTLLPASVLVLFGFALFAAGYVADSPGIAVVGGVIVVGVGAAITVGGGVYEQTGEREVITNESANRTVVETSAQYKPVDLPINLPLGFLTMIGGALLSFQPLAEEAENGL